MLNHTALPSNRIAVFIETSIFTKRIGDYLAEDEYLGLQKFPLKHPDAGVLIRASAGLRKLRWRTAEKGKQGGIRIIYYWHVRQSEIWLLTVYGKNERQTIPAHVLKKIAEEIGNE